MLVDVGVCDYSDLRDAAKSAVSLRQSKKCVAQAVKRNPDAIIETCDLKTRYSHNPGHGTMNNRERFG